MGMIDSIFVDPSKTRVLQFLDATGVVRGEIFEFEGHAKPDTESFKRECLQYYPAGRVRKLKNSADAIGVSRWVADSSGEKWKSERMIPPVSTQLAVSKLVGEWLKLAPTYSVAEFAVYRNFAQQVLAGTKVKAEPGTLGQMVLDRLTTQPAGMEPALF